MLIFGNSASGPSGVGVLSYIVAQAGTAEEILAQLNAGIAAAAAATPNNYVLTLSLAGAGNGSQFAAVIGHTGGYTNSVFSLGTAPFDATVPPQFSDFTLAAPSRAQVLVVEAGTAAEALENLSAAVLAAKASTSTATQQYGTLLAGSSDGQRWMAATVLAIVTPA